MLEMKMGAHTNFQESGNISYIHSIPASHMTGKRTLRTGVTEHTRKLEKHSCPFGVTQKLIGLAGSKPMGRGVVRVIATSIGASASLLRAFGKHRRQGISRVCRGTFAVRGRQNICQAVPWCRLRETELLADLHVKFWRRTMEAEESLWRRTQLESEPTNLSTNIDADECTGGDDTEDTEGEDNQISHILHIGIPGIEKVWIRKEYLELYNCCNDYPKSDQQNMKPLSVVITGQPGIGKCFTSWSYHY
jgi:hypothetical protein